jgi:hypothetical protein
MKLKLIVHSTVETRVSKASPMVVGRLLYRRHGILEEVLQDQLLSRGNVGCTGRRH